MTLLNADSLGATVDAVNAAFFFGPRPAPAERKTATLWYDIDQRYQGRA